MAQSCLLVCADDVHSVGCVDCSRTFCEDRFTACTGFQPVAP